MVLPRAGKDGCLGLSQEGKLALPLPMSSVHTLRGLDEALLPWGGPSCFAQLTDSNANLFQRQIIFTGYLGIP